MKKVRKIYDTIIIGAGPSGVQAGLYLLRANKSVCVFHTFQSGSLINAEMISNFYGQNNISGIRLYNNGLRSIKELGAEIIESVVTYIEYDFENELYKVCDVQDARYAKTVILAMGKETKVEQSYKLVAKEKISYCATCDGFFYRNKHVALVGNTEYAFTEYNHLSNVTNRIDVLLNEKKPFNSFNALENVIYTKINKIENTKDNRVKVTFDDKTSYIYDGVFIAEGNFGTSALASTIGVYSENGFIVVNENMSTNVNGVFACGDIIGGTFQIAKAACDGMQAGFAVISYLNQLNVKKDKEN